MQESDANGKLTFRTIFPAAYMGRWPHMHFEIYESLDAATAGGAKLRTSQLAMPKETCELVYATDGYEQSVANLAQTSLDTDMVFSDGYKSQLASVSGSVDDGFAVKLNVACELQPAQVAVLVGDLGHVVVAQARDVGVEVARLGAADLEHERAARLQPRRRLLEHADQDVEALLPAVVGERGLEAERVALQQRQRAARDVRHDGDDHVGRAEVGRDRREQVARVGLDAVGARVRDRVGIEVGADDPRARAARAQRRRDRAGAGAQIDRDAAVRQPRRRALGHQLGVPARDVDVWVHDEAQAAEVDEAGDPGERLARLAPRHQLLQPGRVARGRLQQFLRLLVGGDEAAAHQAFGQINEIHARIVSMIVPLCSLPRPSSTATGRRPSRPHGSSRSQRAARSAAVR